VLPANVAFCVKQLSLQLEAPWILPSS